MTGQDVVAEARKWLGTPFKAKGRLRGLGLDCVGLPLMVAEALGLSDKSREPLNGRRYSTYSDQPLGTYVHDMCVKHLVAKPVREMKPGDILTLNVSTFPCHVAIVGEHPKHGLTLIHAYNGGPGKVIEHLIDIKWRRRIAGCFRFPEVSE
jgi:NlpC/P60 family putative phage cell wall peptidase